MPETNENHEHRPVALLLTHTADHFTIDRVADALARHGVDPVRFNTDTFPGGSQLITKLTDCGQCHELRLGEVRVNSTDVRAVWLRKLWPPTLDENLDEQYQQYCQRESRAALLGFFNSLHAARWIDRPERMQRAEDKLHQIRIAIECGLTVPRTLVTNSPDEARAMFHELADRGEHTVVKMLTPMTVTMGRPTRFVYTTMLSEDDLGHLDSLRHCPMVFQQMIEKQFELRIVFVGGRCFAGRIDAGDSEHGAVDWRRADPSQCKWKGAGVPDLVQQRMRRFMDRLGLTFAVFDAIVTPDNEHVFLEVNPGGEWGMLERDLGLPISQAIADALVGEPMMG